MADLISATAQMITVAEAVEAFAVSTEIRYDAAPPVSARLRATARGVFEARIAGIPVSDGVLAPGWSAYQERLSVREYDVTDLIRDGARLEFAVGNGWWRGKLGFESMGLNYGDRLGIIGELVLTWADGQMSRIVTDASWDAATVRTSRNTIYGGQTIDAGAMPARLEVVVDDAFDAAVLTPASKPEIMRHESISPIEIWEAPSGRTLVDFGQNIVGWVRLRAQGPAGTRITVRHAEVLEHGELGRRPLRGAEATDVFVLSGRDEEFEPTMTFHGFRYIDVDGYPGRIRAADVEAVVVHSRMDRTGTFECSDPRVNRLVENAVWSQRGNFLDVPTDCPQRDERLGWTGDIAAFAPAACFQFDVADILHGWMLDLIADTEHNGYVPIVVPDLFRLADEGEIGDIAAMRSPTAIWGDAAAWVPEALWWAYGDRDRLAAHYPAVVFHLESVLPMLDEEGLWNGSFQFGDWLDPTAPPDAPSAGAADPAVIATASLYRSVRFAELAARELGHERDEARWRALADRLRSSFRRSYVLDDGRIMSDAQAVYALAIRFDLLEACERERAGARLADLVRAADHRIATGFAGTPFVTWALAETGHVETAYRLLLQTECPSWLYAVEQGATTIWERWDSMLPDGSINPGEMTSFNHYALGAVVDWLYRGVAGIQAASPGHARLRLAPTPGPGLEWARGALDTPEGRVESSWMRLDDAIVYEFVIPPGVEADIVLPDGTTRAVRGGRHRIESVPSLRTDGA